MKEMKERFLSGKFWAWLVLMLLAVVTGGTSAMAVADNVEPHLGDEGNEPASKDDVAANEPVDADKSDLLAPGGKTAGQDLTGSQASATQIDKGGLEEEDWDKEVTKFHPYRTPLISIMKNVTTTVPCAGYKKIHARVGGETLDGVTKTAIDAGATIKLTAANFSGSLLPFYKTSTVFVPTVGGYAEGSKTKVEGALMLVVVEKTKNEVVLQAINGPAVEEGADCSILENMTCPAIPAGTQLLCGSTALSESQMSVPAENYQPRKHEVYLQKRAFSIVFTEDFQTIKKKIPHTVNDMKADALTKFLMRAERSYWHGVQRRWQSETKDGAIEYTYSAAGLLSQLTNSYGIGDTYTFEDLVALHKLQFTEFAENNEAYALCGKNAIERLENIKIPEGRKAIFDNVNKFDITFKQFVTNYGTTYFAWDQTMDFMGLEDCIVIVDFKGARHYVKTNSKETTNDMSKDGYDPREAKRLIHIEADCLALRGYNSVLVGPESKITNMGATGVINNIVSASTLPTTAAKGAKFALTADYVSGETTYTKGTVYVWNGTKWEEYKGQDVAA